MTTAPTRVQYDNLHLLMDVVDTVRHARADAQRVAGDALDEEALVAQVQAIYQSQGMEVDEATIAQGLAMLKARRFEFTPPAPGLATRLAKAYATRAQWGPRALVGAATTAGVAVAVGIMVWVAGALAQAGWMDDARQSLADQQGLAARSAQLDAAAQALPGQPAALFVLAGQARTHLVQGAGALAGLAALPAGERALEEYYQADRDLAQEVVEQRQAGLAKARADVDAAGVLIERARQLDRALGMAGVFNQPVPDYLEDLKRVKHLAFQAGLQAGDAAAMLAAVGDLEQALALDQRRLAVEGQARQVGAERIEAIATALDQARGALVAGNLASAQSLVGDVEDKLAGLAVSYTLRIVSEPHEKTGVWRYYGDDRSKRNFYIVVDAIDATGTPVEVPVRSVEDGQVRTTSRFAVRVPEAVYDRVGQDKMEDGIVDDAVFGHKRAGELEPEYRFDTQGGAITHW